MQTLHASLDDEDYGILYNFVMNGLEGNPYNQAAVWILVTRTPTEDGFVSGLSLQEKIDYATLLILESGREIP